ncbi:hypothetical protein [uncultured Psychroserpens sp.]|uniref:hypothetical protein n=1 Tax=uncultured Psychroserpens sp. TaxID=255436 RepID=UPI00261E7068|nr:hypothetical protein [uncultured Psychroserpens sp.]
MDITKLNLKIDKNSKLNDLYLQFQKLLSELRKKELSDTLVSSINKDIEALQLTTTSENTLKKQIKTLQTRVIKNVEKASKIVPKNYYRNQWLALGMAVFGIPIGVVFGLSMGNMAFLGIGLPIGMAIGTAIGASMDKKALNEGRQLDIDIKF